MRYDCRQTNLDHDLVNLERWETYGDISLVKGEKYYLLWGPEGINKALRQPLVTFF